jgi:predicted ATPase/class 3 adenylate cyclase
VARELPSGTVTFLFTDVEGSTRLLHELGIEGYAEALGEHRRILRDAFGAQGGVEVDTQGDAFFVAFPTAPGALRAAAEATEGLAPGPIHVRMGIHTGTPHLVEEGYVGMDVHRAARIAACGHGGQVLVSASTAALVGTGGLRDLGEHRLKDLSAAERIYQLGEGEFPPLKSLFRTNLPVLATPFLGRERELGDVLGLLARDDVRLLTLTGTGGTGKTRLGLQAAAGAAEDHPDGVFWVPLAALRDSELVLEEAAQVLGAKDALAEYIADKQILLLFDNFEQVVEAAGSLAELLSICPRLKLMVTSREPLRIAGEQEYLVPPLVHEEGVGFFLARARAINPEFEAEDAVSEICRRLDDLPLALELAAARVKALSAPQILERLEQRLGLLTGGARDSPERQRTLRSTIEWSFDLLADEEKGLFGRLAVFRGGCTLEAAEEIVAADLDTLQSLVDKSLLRFSGERYWMLETIREYAVEQLEASGQADELRRRHADYFLALADEAEKHTQQADPVWLDRLDQEGDNLRAALDRLETLGETQLVLSLAGALIDFWSTKGYFVEGSRRLVAALAADTRPTAARAKALIALADLSVGEADAGRMRARSEEALALYRRLGDTRGIAASLLLLGSADADDQDFAAARDRWEEAERLFHEAGDPFNALFAHRMLAWAYDELGDLERARSIRVEVLAEARAAGYKHLEMHALEAMAHKSAQEGEVGQATEMLAKAYELNRELGDQYREAVIVCRFARVLAYAGEAEAATRVLAAGETRYEDFGGRPIGWVRRGNDEALDLIRAKLDEAAFAKACAQGRSLTADEAVRLALDTLRQGRGRIT